MNKTTTANDWTEDVYFRADCRNICINTDDHLPVLFEYNLKRVTSNIHKPKQKFLRCNIHFVQHSICFYSKPQDGASPILQNDKKMFDFPPLKGCVHITEAWQHGQMDIACQIEINYISNTITSDLLNSIVLFQVKIEK
jgi:hypothetical protein